MISVLVVDDDPAECSLLEASMRAQGFTASAVTSAEAALELLLSADFDVVVTDLNMKAMSGIQLCEHLVAAHPDVAVVLVTAFGSIETAVGGARTPRFGLVACSCAPESAFTVRCSVGG